MKLRITIIIAAVLLVLGGAYAIKMLQVKKMMEMMASMAPPPPTVSAMPAETVRWASVLDATASLQGSESITVRTELAGVVRRIGFVSGAQVQQGDLLVELDTSTEQAELAGLVAASDLAAINLKRAQELRAKSTIAQSELDSAEAAARQANAAVDQVRAVIAKKHILAPFPGRLGIRKVNLGEFLDAGAQIVVLENASLTYADFSIPQQETPRLAVGQSVALRVDAYPDRVFRGRVEAINPKVSDTTRNIGVRAVFENPDMALKGGMFGSVSVAMGTEREVVVVPVTSIVYSTYGNYVYVLTPDAKGGGMVQQQFVTLGDKRGDQVAVLKGLKTGDQVVSTGQIKLRNGIPVLINNSVQPSNDSAPKPSES